MDTCTELLKRNRTQLVRLVRNVVRGGKHRVGDLAARIHDAGPGSATLHVTARTDMAGVLAKLGNQDAADDLRRGRAGAIPVVVTLRDGTAATYHVAIGGTNG